MEVGNKSIYDGQFLGNILVVGKTGCEKHILFRNSDSINFLVN